MRVYKTLYNALWIKFIVPMWELYANYAFHHVSWPEEMQTIIPYLTIQQKIWIMFE